MRHYESNYAANLHRDDEPDEPAPPPGTRDGDRQVVPFANRPGDCDVYEWRAACECGPDARCDFCGAAAEGRPVPLWRHLIAAGMDAADARLLAHGPKLLAALDGSALAFTSEAVAEAYRLIKGSD